MTPQRIARGTLLFVQAFTAVTAVLGGAALVAGSVLDWSGTPLAIPEDYLAGSPFSSFVLPGLALALVVGGSHAVAFVMVARRMRWAMLASAIAGFGVLVWIFVQMIYIPFSPLQATYFVLGVVELAAVLVQLDVLHPWSHARVHRPGAAQPPEAADVGGATAEADAGTGAGR
ncbi:hypothetical protein ACFPER_05790 [Agromyces aurantiacus]|uniref:DUF4383 domain-containing protein n=1 Tax=Agromyces aurantiacus TaxID=165814 RepID=A0ABV9R4B0_9MICO|nr:hypothetical protein [Agromyces aurantiacus]MBM7502970.1 hypothetical protein [Agromyces aurantiacus]